MTPAEFIRKDVLGFRTQAELAEILGTTQPTVCRWERKGRFPPAVQLQIRDLAKGKPWNDAWFFEVPDEAGA